MRLSTASRARRAVAGLLGACLATVAAPPAAYRDPSGVVVEVTWRLLRPGSTVLEFPPLGEVRARTHQLPLELRVRLARLEPSVVAAVTGASSPSEYRRLQEGLVRFVRRGAVRFAVRQSALAAAGAAAAAYLAGARGLSLPRAAVAGAAGAAALAAATALSYDLQAFEAPEYRGVLEAAPQLLEAVREGVGALNAVSRRVVGGVAELADLYRRLEQAGFPDRPADELVVAHVSDLHNNPAAYDLLLAVTRQFGVDAVIDTGDLADFESPMETGLMSRIASLGVPYLLVPGNHDYPEAVAAVDRLPGVSVADGRVMEFAGLRVLAVPDPHSRQRSAQALNADEVAALGQVIAREVAKASSSGRPIHLIAVHNHHVAEAVEPGSAAAVLFGHDHVARVFRRGDTLYVDAGSTGAQGLRGLDRSGSLPFTLALLRFGRSAEELRLWAVDLLSFDGVTGELSLQRTLAAQPPRREPAAPGEPARGEPVPAR